jgi:DNA-binding transcriptional LysR family regulator
MNLARIDLNLLLAFEAMMQARSVSRAAATLGLRQPAMSAALARLRRLFGDELFVRTGGEMRPSPKALRLAPGILDALRHLRAALGQEVAFDPATATDVFTLALADYGSAVLLPGLARLVGREAPGIDLRVAGYEKEDAGAIISQGLADLAVGVFPDPPEGAVVRPLFEETFVGVARVGHPALAKPLDPEAYARLDHALFTMRRDSVGAVDAALAALGLTRRVALTLPHVLALPPVLAATDLVAAMPTRLASRLGDPRLATFPIPLPLAPWRLDMLWNPLARSDQASAWLRSMVERASGVLAVASSGSEGVVPSGDQSRRLA